METQVDIQMPLIKGGFVIGDVIQRLLMQDVDFSLYIDAGADFEFSEDHDRLLELITGPAEDKGRNVGIVKKRIRITSKRNRLRLKGDSPYVYLADADLLLPQKPFFGGMIRALAENTKVGAIGLCCYSDRDHVSCASMMLRRRDFVKI
ncbi:hypothetical protein IH992_15890, partial [Candidatus Poribacteria bacterium]|nr:hypothetical protein [Candidatus Poribacteria bacterium]